VPIQLTKAFREARTDEKFQGWLKMQDAAMGIVFPIEDAPEVRDSVFTEASFGIHRGETARALRRQRRRRRH
jgi:hypothetical protein